MAEPITWRTVTGAPLADAYKPLMLAQQALGDSFDGLKGAVGRLEAQDEANWKQGRDSNTQAFLDRLHGARTVAEYQTLQASGALDAMLARAGAQIDHAAARTALDGRLATLQARDQAGWAYANAALDHDEAPVVDRVRGLLAQGRLQDATPLIGTLSERNQAGLLASLDERQQKDLGRERDRQRFDIELAAEARRAAMHPLDLAARRASTAASLAATDSSRAQAAATRSRMARDEQDAAEADATRRLAAALKDNTYAEGVLSPSHAPQLMKLMQDNHIGHDDAERNAVIDRLTRIGEVPISVARDVVENGQRRTVTDVVKLPPALAAVKAAILSGDDQWFNLYNQGWANDIEAKLKKQMQAVYTRPGADHDRPVAFSPVVEDFLAWQNALRSGVSAAPQEGRKRR